MLPSKNISNPMPLCKGLKHVHLDDKQNSSPNAAFEQNTVLQKIWSRLESKMCELQKCQSQKQRLEPNHFLWGGGLKKRTSLLVIIILNIIAIIIVIIIIIIITIIITIIIIIITNTITIIRTTTIIIIIIITPMY